MRKKDYETPRVDRFLLVTPSILQTSSVGVQGDFEDLPEDTTPFI